jgi:hypothetical protein
VKCVSTPSAAQACASASEIGMLLRGNQLHRFG